MRHAFLMTACLSWVLAHGARILLAPVLPLIEDEFAITHGQAGRLFLGLVVGYCSTHLTAAFWSRWFGYRRTLRTALLVLTLVLISMRWMTGLAGITVVVFLIGLMTGAFIPCIIPLLSMEYGKGQWGRSIAVFESSASAGQLLAPVLAVAVLAFLPWRYVYWAMAVLSLSVFFLFLRTAPDREPEAARPRGSLSEVFSNPNLLTLAYLWTLSTSAAAGLGFLLPVYLVKELGMELTAANLTFALGRGFGIPVTLAAGVLADRGVCRPILGWILVIAGLGQLGIAWWPGIVGVGVFVVVEGAVALSFFGVGLLLVARLSTSGAMGAALGFVVGVGAGVGFGVTPWILGVIADAWSFQAGIAGLGVLTTLSSLLVLKLERV